MGQGGDKPGIAASRLDADDYLENFSDLHPPLDAHEAAVEAERCYFCYDAPCMNACPTEIDIPMFIRHIASDNPLGSAKTIFDQNILGGICARVCPTETLCEEVCVREIAEGKPVKIGLLQRYATDAAMAENARFYERAPNSGKKIAIVGGGPAGLACAHRLAVHGHDSVIFEARSKAGGLNEFGIAAYKTVDDFAQKEVDYVTAIGGIDIKYDKELGRDIHLGELLDEFDAVFLGLGLDAVNRLDMELEDAKGVDDAVDWIADLRQSKDLSKVPVGERVVVIGGGMTAIDAAVQAKGLGAEEVTICYRGPVERMKASEYEQEIAKNRGVTIRYNMQPSEIIVEDEHVEAMVFNRNGRKVRIECDQIFKAIGQQFVPAALNGSSASLELENGRIMVDSDGATSISGLWAGGDCVNAGDDLTVTAVAQGRDAAEAIHRNLSK
ncbi:MAG: NAD(P)-dependent oxidoreductase [Rhizobiaceae bacterium]